MKLSLRWIFDHLKGDFNSINLKELLAQLNIKVTEVEQHDIIKIEINKLTILQIKKIEQDSVIAWWPERKVEVTLPARPDAQPELHFLASNKNDDLRWATMNDFGASKETLMPAVQLESDWKKKLPSDDVILTISNTAITHRPDLWSHRGFAREIGALLDIPLREEHELLAANPLHEYGYQAPAENLNPFSITIENPKQCPRFATLYLSHTENKASLLLVAARLASIDAKPISLMVDLTNYVMFDWGQPLHAFDADKLTKKQLSVGTVYPGTSLELLDGQTVKIPADAIVIKDGNQPTSLAGLMGSAASAMSSTTQNILLESANFDQKAIRMASTLLHLRTEASARFEKGLDPHQNISGLQRFIALATQVGIPIAPTHPLVSLGYPVQAQTLLVKHTFLEQTIGTKITESFVIKTLTALGFGVLHQEGVYDIMIPTWRARDIRIPQDIAEEVGRFWGWDSVPHHLPPLALAPHSLRRQVFMRALKNYWAFSAKAHEVINYPVFDDEFLATLAWKPTNAVRLANPLSRSAGQLVTSLIPNLIKNVVTNSGSHESSISFFETNSIWHTDPATEVSEIQSFASIAYSKDTIDFYEQKSLLTTLFNMLGYNVTWAKADHQSLAPWFHPYKTAALMSESTLIGYAGMANPAFTHRIMHGEAFLCALNLDLLYALARQDPYFKPLAKYPDTWLDVSMLIPANVPVAQLEEIVLAADSRIFRVTLIDLFTKEEWGDKRSITMRLFARDQQQTLAKEQIDQIQDGVHRALSAQGATIR